MTCRIALALPMLALLVGCAATAPESLRPVTRAECVNVAADLWWTDTRGIGFDTWEEGLRSGIYRAELQNDQGTFFRGAGAPVWQRTVLNKNPPEPQRQAGSRVGGVWLPADRQRAPKVYYYVGVSSVPTEGIDRLTYNTATQTPRAGPVAAGVGGAIAGAIIDAAIAADIGKIRYFPAITDKSAVTQLKLVFPCADLPAIR